MKVGRREATGGCAIVKPVFLFEGEVPDDSASVVPAPVLSTLLSKTSSYRGRYSPAALLSSD